MCGCLIAIIIGLFIFALVSTYWFILLIAMAIIAIVVIIQSLSKKKENNNDNTDTEQKTSFNSESDGIKGQELSAGKYVGGRDIETGIYDVIVVSGSGFIETDIPEKLNEYLSSNHSNQYKNIEIGYGTNLRVDTGITIKLYNRREYVQTTNLENEYYYNHSYKPIDNFDDLNGWEFESFCAKVLGENGYKNVQVTRGSGDQGVDILAERDGIKYAVQCKNYSQPVGNKAVQEIYSGMNFYKCHVGIVMTNNYFTQSAKELAKEEGIVLWDRDYLIKFVKRQ